MTNVEKTERLAVLISPDTADAEQLLALIETAEGIVLDRRDPFGYPEGTEVEKRFEHIQHKRRRSYIKNF